MTAVEKAFTLFGLMRTEISLLHDSELLKDKIAKNLALIAVNEAIEFEQQIVKQVEWLSEKAEAGFRCEALYWQEVKQEIEKL